jgi:hypothetical protein
MVFPIDARIPVVFGSRAQSGPADALLLEGEGDGDTAAGQDWFQPDPAHPSHPTGCACCPSRTGAAMALARLLLARGRGSGLFFRRVIAVTTTPAGREAVRLALAEDPLASACFRLEA